MKFFFRLLLFAAILITQPGIAQTDSVRQKFYKPTFTLIKKYNSNAKSEEVKSDIMFLESVLPKFKHDWNYTNALHKIEIIKGRQALMTGNVVLAKTHLEKAGNALTAQDASEESLAFGSPQLRTFGPNMSLAKELLENGERDSVIGYLKQCSKVWEAEFSKVKDWEAEINAGKVPDFDANLFY